jgi:RHS repeat-associated protein
VDGMLLTLTRWSGEIAGSVERTYDNDLRVGSLQVNSEPAVFYGYDGDSLLTQAGDLQIIRHPDHGLVTDTTLGQVTTNRSHNQFGEWESYTASFAGAPLFQTSFVRDDLGRITEKTETVDGVSTIYEYFYDLAGRLDLVYRDGFQISDYDYDPNSNRAAYTDEFGVTVTGTFDDQDRMLSYAGATYTYSDNGELTSKTEGGLTTSYFYDVMGNLRNVTLPDGTEIEYIIDGRNRRIGKKVNGVLVQSFLYANQLNPIVELDGAGNVVATFVYGSRVNVPEYIIKGSETYRVISDHLGSPRIVVDAATGAVAQRLDYDEFGRVLQDTNPGFQPFGFAGGIWDADVGLLRFGARDYEAKTGRWTAKDASGIRGRQANFYSYALADPVNNFDITGFQVRKINYVERWWKQYLALHCTSEYSVYCDDDYWYKVCTNIGDPKYAFDPNNPPPRSDLPPIVEEKQPERAPDWVLDVLDVVSIWKTFLNIPDPKGRNSKEIRRSVRGFHENREPENRIPGR